MPRLYRTNVALHEHQTSAFGEILSSSLARMLQQAAIEASTDAGFSDAWYRAAGSVWVIRRSTIERLGPLRAGDPLTITTWVADFRRVRSRREYEIRRAGAPDPVALAHTDWVYLDRSTAKLARIPEEMLRGFVPEGAAPTLPREPLAVPEPPGDAFASERVVRFGELDGMLHVNNAVSFDYVEDAFLEAAAAGGWSPERCREAGGFLRPAFHDVEYLDEARLGDGLRCLSWSDAKGSGRLTSVTRTNDDRLLTRARSRWIWIEALTGAPAPFPGGFPG